MQQIEGACRILSEDYPYIVLLPKLLSDAPSVGIARRSFSILQPSWQAIRHMLNSLDQTSLPRLDAPGNGSDWCLLRQKY